MARTRTISAAGIAVSVLHTGQHYADDVDEDGIIYHYPTTGRKGHDANEIESVKNAQRLNIPVFVIVQKGTKRQVNGLGSRGATTLQGCFYLNSTQLAS